MLHRGTVCLQHVTLHIGTVRALHGAAPLQRGTVPVTPQESARVTTKADCYGFAVLMWELATRLYPWLGLGLLHVRLSGVD